VIRLLIAFSCLVAVAFALQNASQKNNSGITIQGRVLQEPGGQPIRKASVQFSARDGQSNGQFSDTTDTEGRFKVDDLKPGRYMATVEHPGFVQSVSGKQSASILLLSGQGTLDSVFYMQPAAVITGKVTDLEGDPMSNIGISALRVGSAREQGISITRAMQSPTILGNFASPICGRGDTRLPQIRRRRDCGRHMQKKRARCRKI
jgi:hypothetical protein